MDTTLVIWLVLLFGFLVFEILTTSFVSICFSIAAIPAIIANVLGFDLLIQLVVYAIALAICLYFLVPLLRKVVHVKSDSVQQLAKTNLDLIIGKTGICIETILPNQDGAIKVEGKEWTARIEDSETINIDDLVIVQKIAGSKVIVIKKESEK